MRWIQKEGTAVWGGKAEGWEQMTYTSLRERNHSSKGQRSLSSTSLIPFPLLLPSSTSLSTPFTESDTCWASWAPLHKFMLMSAMKTTPHLQIFVEQRSVHFLSFFYTSLFPTFSFSTLSSYFILFFYWFIFPKPQPETMRLSHMMWNVVSAEIINTRL